MVKLLATAVLALSFSSVSAVELPAPKSPSDALDQIMKTRHVAQDRAHTGASPDELRQSALELEELLAVLDKEPYRDFTSQSKWMYAEYLNIALPLAEIHARLGDKEKALRALEVSSRVILLPAMAGSIETMPAGRRLARICVKRHFYADGSDFVGQGIQPTHRVVNTVETVRGGSDPALAEAISLLTSSIAQFALKSRQ